MLALGGSDIKVDLEHGGHQVLLSAALKKRQSDQLAVAEEEQQYQQEQRFFEQQQQLQIEQRVGGSGGGGETLVHYATRRRRVQMAVALVNANAHVDVEDLAFKWGPKCGLRVVKALLKKPRKDAAIPVNALSNTTGLTPLAQCIVHMKSLQRQRVRCAQLAARKCLASRQRRQTDRQTAELLWCSVYSFPSS